jgi:peptidoglycan/xylan/chitin deacetylase (PgdA/CDA1 family)/SAM-dependent methyltransferase
MTASPEAPDRRATAVAVVVPCFNLGRTLHGALASVEAQTHRPEEVVVVDDGSTDVYTRQVLARLRDSGTRVVSTPNRGPAAARNLGIRLTTSPLIVLLDADDLVEPSYFAKASAVLAAKPDLGFVSCGMAAFGESTYVWNPPPCTFLDTLVRGGVHVSTMFRRAVFHAVGGFDEELPAYEDTDFWLSAIERGFAGEILHEPLLRYRVRRGSRYHRALLPDTYLQAKGRILAKHATAVAARREEILAALGAFAAELRAHGHHLDERKASAEAELASVRDRIVRAKQALASRGEESLDWGVLRRLEPFVPPPRAREHGVEAWYVEAFMTRATAGDGSVLRIDAAEPSGDSAKGDFPQLDRIRPGSVDCIQMVDVLRYARDPLAAIRRARSALKPDGVLLASLPCVSPFHDSADEPTDRWRFTEASARELFAEVFPLDSVEVTTFGNLPVCVAALHGLEAAELATSDLEEADPWYPLVVCVRAVKPGSSAPAAGVPRGDGGALVLLYHRVASLTSDTHGLCTTPEQFERHMEHLRRFYIPFDLREIVQLARLGRIPRRAVAVTFDDGYLDNLTTASPILSGLGIPATFFLNTEDVEIEHESWWDTVERILLCTSILPPVLEFASQGGPVAIPTGTSEERRAAVMSLHGLLLYAGTDERRIIIDQLLRWCGRELPVRSTHRLMTAAEIAELSRRPGHEVGAHTTHHLLLTAHPQRIQREEMEDNRNELERLVGRGVSAFSYPYGDFAAETVEVVRELGFEIAVTVKPGVVRPESDPLLLPRLEVKGDAAVAFEETLESLLTPAVGAAA